jgi:hypothetical protein
MIITTVKNRPMGRLARRATLTLVAAAAFAGVVAAPAEAATRTLYGPVRDDKATAQQDIPGLERTCRSQYSGWPRNSRIEAIDSTPLGGTPRVLRAFVDCLPPR